MFIFRHEISAPYTVQYTAYSTCCIKVIKQEKQVKRKMGIAWDGELLAQDGESGHGHIAREAQAKGIWVLHHISILGNHIPYTQS